MEQECIMSGVGNMFSIFLPGDDIPDCFVYKDEGPQFVLKCLLVVLMWLGLWYALFIHHVQTMTI